MPRQIDQELTEPLPRFGRDAGRDQCEAVFDMDVDVLEEFVHDREVVGVVQSSSSPARLRSSVSASVPSVLRSPSSVLPAPGPSEAGEGGKLTAVSGPVTVVPVLPVS